MLADDERNKLLWKMVRTVVVKQSKAQESEVRNHANAMYRLPPSTQNKGRTVAAVVSLNRPSAQSEQFT